MRTKELCPEDERGKLRCRARKELLVRKSKQKLNCRRGFSVCLSFSFPSIFKDKYIPGVCPVCETGFSIGQQMNSQQSMHKLSSTLSLMKEKKTLATTHEAC